MASLYGAAREACLRRLSQHAEGPPTLPPIADKAKLARLDEETRYREAVRRWKRTTENTLHPCPPHDDPVHKLYIDKCVLANGGIMFRYKF